MHELSIALSILELVEEEAQRLGTGRVAAIRVKVGPLSGIVTQPLLSAFELARESSSLPHCELKVEEIPIVVHCPTCDADRPIDSPQWMICPECGTPATEVIQGRELEIAGLEVET